jgi:8-oxo-dGTP diphosphatase
MKHELLVENWRKYLKEQEEGPVSRIADKYESAHVIIQDRKGRVLVLKRSEVDDWMPGKWSLPGGGKREEEELLQGAIREVKEETGLDILPEDLIFLEQISQQQNHAFFLAKSFVGSVQLDSENSHFTWVRPNQLIEKDCVPDLIQVLSSVVGMNEEKIPKDFEKLPFTNKLKGGAADKAKPEDFEPKKLRKGIEHETEHSSDIEQAKETAADHLIKYKYYYDELEKMEKKLEKGDKK